MPTISGSGGASPTLGTDGWTTSNDTWVFASSTTFTIVGVDRTATFTPGTRLKLTNTTLKFFVVVSSAFSTDTTVTVTGGTDFTLANAAITAPFYSYQANPQGYPSWFTYSAAATGFSALTVTYARFCVVGRACTVAIRQIGTSNATTFGLTMPVAFADIGVTNVNFGPIFHGTDAGTDVTSGGAFTAGTTMRLDKTLSVTDGWTASGTKSAVFSFTYPI